LIHSPTNKDAFDIWNAVVHNPIYMRVSCRNGGEPDYELYASIGLRLVLDVPDE